MKKNSQADSNQLTNTPKWIHNELRNTWLTNSKSLQKVLNGKLTTNRQTLHRRFIFRWQTRDVGLATNLQLINHKPTTNPHTFAKKCVSSWHTVDKQLTIGMETLHDRGTNDCQRFTYELTITWQTLTDELKTNPEHRSTPVTNDWQIINDQLTFTWQTVDKQVMNNHKSLIETKQRINKQLATNRPSLVDQLAMDCVPIDWGAAGWDLMSPLTVGCSLPRFMLVHHVMVQDIVSETLNRWMWSSSTPTVTHMPVSKMS